MAFFADCLRERVREILFTLEPRGIETILSIYTVIYLTEFLVLSPGGEQLINNKMSKQNTKFKLDV